MGATVWITLVGRKSKLAAWLHLLKQAHPSCCLPVRIYSGGSVVLDLDVSRRSLQFTFEFAPKKMAQRQWWWDEVMVVGGL